MLAIAQKPLMSSSSSVPSSTSSVTSSSSSSPAANDPCSDNSPYPKIVEGESSGLKPAKYCKIRKDEGKIFFCKSSGSSTRHECTYTGPYKKPGMMSSMSSMFSKGGKYKRRRSHMKKNRTKKTSRKNRITRRSRRSRR
jgi:hypothetical protein